MGGLTLYLHLLQPDLRRHCLIVLSSSGLRRRIWTFASLGCSRRERCPKTTVDNLSGGSADRLDLSQIDQFVNVAAHRAAFKVSVLLVNSHQDARCWSKHG